MDVTGLHRSSLGRLTSQHQSLLFLVTYATVTSRGHWQRAPERDSRRGRAEPVWDDAVQDRRWLPGILELAHNCQSDPSPSNGTSQLR